MRRVLFGFLAVVFIFLLTPNSDFANPDNSFRIHSEPIEVANPDNSVRIHSVDNAY